MLTVLAADTTSQIAVALAGWKYPVSREAMVLADLFDMQLGSKSKKKPAPYPRPWVKDGSSVERKGNAAGRSKAQVRDILNAHGHNLPV